MSRQAARRTSLRCRSWRITRNWGLTAEGLIEGADAADRARGCARCRARSRAGGAHPVISRRVLLLGIAALGAPRASSGQTPVGVARVLVYTGSMAWRDGIAGGLRDLGWIE